MGDQDTSSAVHNVVTLTVGDELPGEIAQLVAGVAANAEDYVVAGADVAAATTD
jgi:hypothetical protein